MTNWTPVQPLSDEPQDQWFWEPQQFKIGDRVRVRLSGECRIKGPAIALSGELVKQDGHQGWVDGVEGVVTVCPNTRQARCNRFPGHPYLAEYGAPDGRTWCGHFAACELEALP